MATNDIHLSSKQVKALEHLLVEPSVVAASKTSGISLSSMHRLLADPRFAAAYRDAQRRALQSSLAHIQAATVDAVRTLREVCNDAGQMASARVAAAKALLDGAMKATDFLETQARLAALEVKAGLAQDGEN